MYPLFCVVFRCGSVVFFFSQEHMAYMASGMMPAARRHGRNRCWIPLDI